MLRMALDESLDIPDGDIEKTAAGFAGSPGDMGRDVGIGPLSLTRTWHGFIIRKVTRSMLRCSDDTASAVALPSLA